MEQAWWKECAVYQIYPRSFFDSNGDGIGDLNGITQKLDYIASLGVGAVWLNPVYDSPNDDMGYDISNYEAIMREFGTMADFDALLAGLHARGLRLIMDLVVNHSSDEHVWFVESRKSKDNPYRDFYIWRDGKDGKEPNNWASFFTPSAWKYDETTDQWYLHLFSEKQPDLNWQNPAVRAEVYAMMNRWFDRGVDGFRMDVINLIAKAEGLPDGSGTPSPEGYVFAPEHFADLPAAHDYLREMRRTCFAGRDCMCVGETPFSSSATGFSYVDPAHRELDMVFSFDLMDIDSGKSGKWEIVPWNLSRMKAIIEDWQTALATGWNSLFWSNHDQPRPVSRFGSTSSEELRVRSAKMLGVAMHLLRGTPFIYQGEELGMTNVPFRDISDIRDLESLNFYRLAAARGEEQKAWSAILQKGRDNARVPMQWSATENAGFTTGTPWLMVNPNHEHINVNAAEQDVESVLHFYRKLLRLRADSRTLIYGDFALIEREHPQVFGYTRSLDGETYTIVCNMSGMSALLSVVPNGDCVFSNLTDHSGSTLQPYEARVYRNNRN
ncbi:MAG: glucohydrolase [Firmicutes bacterium HGW-Firmicutes-9]|nr:MAG: glucohydrolase [Firmicutes bacterium HGW-Firmicutes-9]